MNSYIPLYQPYLPSFNKYTRYLQRMYENKWLTNNGPLVQEFSSKLAEYLEVPYLVPTSNGTAALQLAYRLFNLKGNVVTTPYSFVATCNSIEWLGMDINFADIDPHTLNLCATKLAQSIDANTSAIVPVHTYGNPCDVKAIDKVAKDFNVKVIYDAAHSFGVKVGQRSILRSGHASAISLHATKLFHSIEGGALILSRQSDYKKAMQMINFGVNPEAKSISNPGFNGKMSEAHAAMGLAMLDDIDMVIDKRIQLLRLYKSLLDARVDYPQWHNSANQNGAYFPILLKNKRQKQLVFDKLAANGIQSRSYFSPSLNTLDHFRKERVISCPNSESVVDRVLCLPLYFSLSEYEVRQICQVIRSVVTIQKSKVSMPLHLEHGAI